MASFLQAGELALKVEGGYQNHPADAGNYNSLGLLVGTNKGISARLYEATTGVIPTEHTMRSLTKDQALSFYKTEFWDRRNLGAITDQFTANHIFDIFLNHAFRDGSRLIQDTLINLHEPVVRDGYFGNQTLQAVNNVLARGKKKSFNDTLVSFRKELYTRLVELRPEWNVFLNGWLSRASSFVTARNVTGAVIIFGIAGIIYYKSRR